MNVYLCCYMLYYVMNIKLDIIELVCVEMRYSDFKI